MTAKKKKIPKFRLFTNCAFCNKKLKYDEEHGSSGIEIRLECFGANCFEYTIIFSNYFEILFKTGDDEVFSFLNESFIINGYYVERSLEFEYTNIANYAKNDEEGIMIKYIIPFSNLNSKEKIEKLILLY